MKKLIISHGSFASGIKGALKIIIGDVESIDTIDAFVEQTSLEDLVSDYIKDIDIVNEKLLVFTDLPAGSVNQYFISNLLKENVHIISGINLPIILELSLMPEELITADTIKNSIKMAKDQIMYFNKNEEVSTSSDDDFDI